MQEKEKHVNNILWENFLRGDKEALGIIYCNCYDLLYNYGTKICFEDELVKDCIQDLFVKLYSNKKLKTIDYVEAFLLYSLRNLLYDALSRNTKEIICDKDNMFNIQVSDYELDQLHKKDDEDIKKSKQLLKAYNSLIPNQKQALYLRFIKKLSYKEISAVLEINEQSAMNLVSRALSSIRSRIFK